MTVKFHFMEAYIPDISFIAQYPDWDIWKKDSYKKLPASHKVKQAGALLFLEGYVSELKPLQDQAGFEARVEDGKAYRSAVWIDRETGSLDFECGCARPVKSEWCPHALAVVAAIDYLFFERNHLPLSPLTDNLNELSKGIDRSQENSNGEGRGLRRVRIYAQEGSTPYIEGDAPLPEGLVQLINPYDEMRRLARNTHELPRYKLGEKLRILVDFIRDSSGLTLEAVTPDGEVIKLEPEIPILNTKLHFIANEKTGLMRFEELAQDIELEAVAVKLCETHYIFKDGRIGQLDGALCQELKQSFLDWEFGFRDFDLKANEFPIEHYNLCVARFGGPLRRLLRQCQFSTQSAREAKEIPAEPAQKARKVSISLALKRAARGNSVGFLATIKSSLDGLPLGLEHIVNDIYEKLRHSSEVGRLLGSSSRVREVFAAAGQLPTLRNESERRKWIDKTTKLAVFSKPEHKRAVGKYLRMIEQDYCRPKSSNVWMCFPEDPFDQDSTYQWQTIEIPFSAILAITAVLYQRRPQRSSFEFPLGQIFVDTDRTILSDLSEICEQFDISLTLDEKQTTLKPLSIEVLLSRSNEVDWFELTPAIRCDGHEIKREDWDRLLSGNLVLEAEDGTLITPNANSSHALESLIEAFDALSHHSGTGKVHRLHLLDWIALKHLGITLDIPQEIEALIENLRTFKGIPPQAKPKGLDAELRHYQQQGFEWLVFLYEHRFGACLADDMGLGKTLQALSFLAHLKEHRPSGIPLRALVALPTSLLFNWQNEAARFVPELSVAAYSGTERSPAIFDTTELVLTSYDLLWRDLEFLRSREFDVTIFDEAQALKNPKSRRTQAASQLQSRFTLCLTGTPMENHPGEFHTIMDLALPSLLGPRKAFDETLRSGSDRLLKRARPFLLRRTKGKILKELPPKIETDTYLEMNETQRSTYTAVITKLREEVEQAYDKQPKARAHICALAALTKLRQICVSPTLLQIDSSEQDPKIQHLVESLQELQAEGQSALVFSQFVKVLDILEGELRKHGIDTLRLDGSTPGPQRKVAVEQFQDSEQPQAFLISLKAGGVGLNLTRASHIFHVDPWWNPSVENQASDRAHRIGQKQTVFVHRLLMHDSIEEKIMQLKQQKRELFEAMIENEGLGDQPSPAIRREDMEFLLAP